MKASERKNSFEKLWVLYALALFGIAASIISSQVYVQQYFSKQENDSRIINIAGRQRMLSQKISKLVLQINATDEPVSQEKYRNQLAQAVTLWEQSHQALLQGDPDLQVQVDNSVSIDSMFQALEPEYNIIVQSAKQLVEQLEFTTPNRSDSLLMLAAKILDNESQYLEEMDTIVFQYDKEARERVLYLEKIELLLLGISLVIILCELLFIFRPTVRQIRKTIKELIQSEKLAKGMARELEVLYNSLEASYQELAEVELVEDTPTLYAKTDATGRFSYVSDIFSGDLEYNVFERNEDLFSWLEQEGYSADQVENIRRRALAGNTWVGEIKATSESGDFIWLLAHIVPTLDDQQQVESLNLICSNQTELKEAQARSHEITREKIDKKVKEQRFRSSLILEGQEEERRRISRDIHDGIGQLLTALKFKVEAIDLAPNMPKRETEVQEAQSLLNHIIREVRRVSFNLNPSALNDYGLIPATKRFCAEANRLSDKAIIFDNETGFINRLEKNIETNLYRIIQESVNNAIKYANANEIRVIFSHNAHYLNVAIQDDGVGFSYQEYAQQPAPISKNGSGLGLFNMRERASFINATLDIHSAEGKGTQINIHLPINERVNGSYQSSTSG
ncbi:sensor histidine kinase [Tunicatimonas pelagia]|uniref:sensor histidine kinase n=1 Tax=Tunicatimonas pelagia TaxID=931531 RepID=UPI002665AF2C|nr:type IV pili methyl-accepting chemotaxis transducer N-terminal domain-containing protein [Tunicatimonas pelagia]WKN45244.1 type IV pili methyl-accepting chemotaxis transducer N-terminal domain-containing protein [Tunicatimonas pelagia]